jgi:predicted CoA-binding protein
MRDIIDHFIHAKHLAVVGVSDKKFGGAIYKSLKKRGVNVYPVHPTREMFDGDTCIENLTEVPCEVSAAILAVSPETAERVVEDAAVGGITHVWFQQGADFSAAKASAEAKGLKTVDRKCILMYVPPVTGIHAVHRFIANLFGKA